MKVFLPVIANLLLPGAGYLILQKRVTFGLLVLASTISGYLVTFLEQMPNPVTPVGKMLCLLTLVLFSMAFAYDAYQLAKE